MFIRYCCHFSSFLQNPTDGNKCEKSSTDFTHSIEAGKNFMGSPSLSHFIGAVSPLISVKSVDDFFHSDSRRCDLLVASDYPESLPILSTVVFAGRCAEDQQDTLFIAEYPRVLYTRWNNDGLTLIN